MALDAMLATAAKDRLKGPVRCGPDVVQRNAQRTSLDTDRIRTAVSDGPRPAGPVSAIGSHVDAVPRPSRDLSARRVGGWGRRATTSPVSPLQTHLGGVFLQWAAGGQRG